MVVKQNNLNRKRNEHERISTFVCKSKWDRYLALEAKDHMTATALLQFSSWGHKFWLKNFWCSSKVNSKFGNLKGRHPNLAPQHTAGRQ